MKGRLSLAVLVVGLTLAGCVQVSPGDATTASSAGPFDALSEPTLALGEFLSFEVPSFDGTPLHVDLQLPEGEGPFPTILEYTPYALLGDEHWGLAQQTGVETPLSGYALVDYYVPRGYAVGVAHVRGTGNSGGCLTIGGPEEAKDGVAIIDHITTQPWSNGKLALVGTSYVGTTPLEVATLQPAGLAAIVPMSPVTEWYRYYFELGAHRRNGDPFPGSSDTDPVLWAALGLAPGPRTGANGGPTEAACGVEFTLQDYAQDDYNAYWKERDIASQVANITVPVLYAQGWRDENVATSMIPRFWPNLTSEKHAWYQQHGHGVPSSKEAFYAYMHRFLDQYLLGKTMGADLLPAVIIEDNLGKYRAEDDWPPADARAVRFNLSGDGALTQDAPKEGKLSWTDDGTGRVDDALAGVNHLVFESAPLDADLHVAGVPRIRLEGSSNMPNTQLAILLYDVAPDGEVTLLTRGYLDARHRESLEADKDLTPGQETVFEFDLHPRDHRVEAGHALRLVVKSTDDYVVRSPYRATNTLTLGPDKAWLDLPAIGAREFSDAAPEPWVS